MDCCRLVSVPGKELERFAIANASGSRSHSFVFWITNTVVVKVSVDSVKDVLGARGSEVTKSNPVWFSEADLNSLAVNPINGHGCLGYMRHFVGIISRFHEKMLTIDRVSELVLVPRVSLKEVDL